MPDILNSPLSLLIAVAVLVAVVLYRKYSGADRRCKACGKGLLEEVSARPEGILSSSTDRGGLTMVRYNVRYRCTHCGETLVRSESRK